MLSRAAHLPTYHSRGFLTAESHMMFFAAEKMQEIAYGTGYSLKQPVMVGAFFSISWPLFFSLGLHKTMLCQDCGLR